MLGKVILTQLMRVIVFVNIHLATNHFPLKALNFIGIKPTELWNLVAKQLLLPALAEE